MPAPKPPITSLFFWLAVSALLLAAAPVAPQSAGTAGERQRLTTADDLAKVFAALDLAQAQDSAQLPQASRDDVADASNPGYAAVSCCSCACGSALRPACTTVVPRLSLVGMIELRV
ncbi:MAG TPA: hypothetical protein PK322_13935 [Opitutaceae bacterium]|mgnify:FL=1|nr:hypothetical protein [Opitutaceae bacterium]